MDKSDDRVICYRLSNLATDAEWYKDIVNANGRITTIVFPFWRGGKKVTPGILSQCIIKA